MHARSFLLYLILLAFARAEEPQRYEVSYPTSPSDYHILYRGTSVDSITRPVRMTLGGEDSMLDTVPMGQSAFYRVLTLPINKPRDSDGDGRSDVFELRNPKTQHPLNPASVSASDGAVSVSSRERFDELAHVDNFPGAMSVPEMKFLILDVDTDEPELYLINTNVHEHHYFFYRNGTDKPSISNGEFNRRTYFTNSQRRNLAGSLIAHDNYVSPSGRQGLYTMEFWPTDPVAFRFVEQAYEILATCLTFMDGNLVYHAAGETQRTAFEDDRDLFEGSLVRTITTEDLFGNVTFAPMYFGVGYGRLVIAEGFGDTLTARDVAIFRNLPNDLTHIAGIITEVPQTPLSHVNLKARQNNTPNAFVKGASQRDDVQALLGKNVRYEVTPAGFYLEEATDEEVDTFLESLRPTEEQIPQRDLTKQRILPFRSVLFSQADAYGAKGANLSELRRLLPDEMTPDGYVIPFYFYDEFMRENGFYAVLDRMLSIQGFSQDAALRESELEKFRKTLRDAPVPTKLAKELSTLQASFPTNTPLRCRSSTNNEDLPGFSGAGLYDSYTHHPDEGSLEKTVKQVWASLWNYRAFEERAFYRIRHHDTAMGVIVHPNFEDEASNGVAVSKNLVDPNWTGYYVNVQLGEDLVTNPTADSIPEEFLVSLLAADPTTNSLEYEVQYVRKSNLRTNGEPILTLDQILDLADQLETIQVHFKNLYRGDFDFAMEIEFKLDQAGQLTIKQARPWID